MRAYAGRLGEDVERWGLAGMLHDFDHEVTITGLEPASVRKKLKDGGFARTVNRDDVYRGAQELGVELDAHIAFVVAALITVAPEIGLGRA